MGGTEQEILELSSMDALLLDLGGEFPEGVLAVEYFSFS